MKLEGDYRFEAGPREVWDALFDTAILAAALPGCEKLALVDGALVGEMTIKIGPISGKFTGKVRFEDKVEPTSYKMIIDGRGPQGFVNATATIALAADGDATTIHYDGDAQIGGKIASVGARLIDASARAITKQSLDNLHGNIKVRTAAHRLAAIPRNDAVPKPEAASETRPAQESLPTVEPHVEPPAEPPKPVYKQAQAGELATAVAKEVGKTLLPIILGVLVVVAFLLWLLLR